VDAIKDPDALTAIDLNGESGLRGTFFYPRSFSRPPAWVADVDAVLSSPLESITSSSASGVLVLEASERLFAVTFGYGKGLLDPARIERQFGLRVALNRIDPSQIRSMDTKTFEDLVVTRAIQSSKNSDIPTFGVDVSRDILRAVAGVPRDLEFAKRLAGSDALAMVLDIEVADLEDKCVDLLEAFLDTSYKADFEWIDHLSIVRDGATVSELDDQLVDQLRSKNTSTTHMATPEPLSWEEIESFSIGGARGKNYDDLDLDKYLDDLEAGVTKLTIDLLKGRRVSVKYARSGVSDSLWSVYLCLVSEQRLNEHLYVLIEGRWFSVSETLVGQVDQYVASIPSASMVLTDALQNETEPAYNMRMCAEHPEDLLLLDKKIKRPGGASSGIEFCDLLSSDGTLIHVKRKSRSATLSHLFAQGTVSATTFIGDPEFRDEVRDAIRERAIAGSENMWLALVPDGSSPVETSRHRVSYVVLANAPKSGGDWLPFFSKLNLMQHAKQLRNMHFEVSISRIGN
jgi:uncharacterized protein (TIGR04141 family)